MKLTNQQRKYGVWGGAAALLCGAAYVLTLSTEPEAALEPPDVTSLTGGFDTREVSLNGLARRLDNLEEDRALDARELNETLSRLETRMNSVGARVETALSQNPDERQESAIRTLNGRMAGMERVLQEMQRQLDMRASAPPAVIERDVPAEPDEEPIQQARVMPKQDPQPLYDETPAIPMIEQDPAFEPAPAPEITLYAPEEAETGTLAETIPPLLVPAGSVIGTVMITGLDAPTGVQAQENPMPVLLRIKREALMPNDWYGDVVDCHMLGSAFGDLSSHRVQIRGELASCVLSDGSIVEQEAQFFATGEDGKVGVGGVLVSKAGSALARAALGGFAEGLSTAASTPDIGGVVTAGGVLSSGTAAGAESAFGQLSEYYIDLAEETYPVIEVPNGRFVDVVLTSTLSINFDGAM